MEKGSLKLSKPLSLVSSSKSAASSRTSFIVVVAAVTLASHTSEMSGKLKLATGVSTGPKR
jgi:hypothetical protein